MSPGDIVAIALAAPLCASVVTNGWSLYWNSAVESPLPPVLHRLLVLTELGVVIALLFPVGSKVQFGAAAVMYLMLAAGSGALLARRGAVPCGCWGRSGQVLSWRLVAANAVLALVAISQVSGRRTISVGGGILLTVSLFALCFVFAVILADMRYVLTGVRRRADGERRWFSRFPDLERP